MKCRKTPNLGQDFNASDEPPALIDSYSSTLSWYRPRGWRGYVTAGRAMLDSGDFDPLDDWIDRAETLLTEWARRVSGHEFIRFGAADAGREVGFWIDAQDAIEQADERREWYRNDLETNPLPKGFSGLYVEVNDHGNVTAWNYSRGRRGRELFAVV